MAKQSEVERRLSLADQNLREELYRLTQALKDNTRATTGGASGGTTSGATARPNAPSISGPSPSLHTSPWAAEANRPPFGGLLGPTPHASPWATAAGIALPPRGPLTLVPGPDGVLRRSDAPLALPGPGGGGPAELARAQFGPPSTALARLGETHLARPDAYQRIGLGGFGGGGGPLALTSGGFERPVPVIIVGPLPVPVKGGFGGGQLALPGGTPTPEKGPFDDLKGKSKAKDEGGGDIQDVINGLMTVAKVGEALGNAYHDKYSTTEQLARGGIRDVLPYGIGDRLVGFAGAVSGRNAGMEEAHVRGQTLIEQAGLHSQLDALGMSLNPMMAGQRSLAASYAGGSAVLPPVLDRGTATGEQQYRDAMRILPLRQASAKADREAKQATAERLAAEGESFKMTRKLVELEREQTELRKRRQDMGGSGADLANIDRQIAAKNLEVEKARGLERDSINKVHGARSREIEAKSESQKASIREEYLGKAEIMQGRAERGKSLAQRLGMMNPIQRQISLAKLQMGQHNNWDSLPDFMKQHLMSNFGEVAGSMAAQAGAASPSFTAAQRLAGESIYGAPGQSPTEMFRKSDEARAKAEELFYKVETEGAAWMVKNAERLYALLQSIMKQSDAVYAKMQDLQRAGKEQR